MAQKISDLLKQRAKHDELHGTWFHMLFGECFIAFSASHRKMSVSLICQLTQF